MTHAATSIFPPLPESSPYAAMLQDHKALWGAVQERVHAGGGEGLVAAITIHPARALVAYIEYGDDMDYPALGLLDLRTDELIHIDSDDLADSPMIEAIAFTDAQAGLVELRFLSGDTHTVTVDFDARSVRW